jgi:hypothetical protein
MLGRPKFTRSRDFFFFFKRKDNSPPNSNKSTSYQPNLEAQDRLHLPTFFLSLGVAWWGGGNESHPAKKKGAITSPSALSRHRRCRKESGFLFGVAECGSHPSVDTFLRCIPAHIRIPVLYFSAVEHFFVT